MGSTSPTLNQHYSTIINAT